MGLEQQDDSSGVTSERKPRGRRVGSSGDVVTHIDALKIVQLRVEKGWTQKELAEKSGLSSGTIGQVEKKPGYRVGRLLFDKLADALHVDPAELLLVNAPTESTPELLNDALKTLTSSLRQAELLQQRITDNINQINSLIGIIGELKNKSN